MLSKAKIKLVHSLAQKKRRAEVGLFVAEGTKIVDELLASKLRVHEVFALESWRPRANDPSVAVTIVGERELGKLSDLTTPHEVVALVAMPDVSFDPQRLREGLVVALEDVQDPGNLGAIVRLCDWFGVADVLATGKTVDCFNPKVVQASMGSIARVTVHYRDDFAAALKSLGKPIYAATLDGDDLYATKLQADGVLVFGNEGSGISGDVVKLATKRVRIPNVNSKAESLNVASAVAIVCSEARRQSLAR